MSTDTIPGIRTRFAVIMDRFYAGVPFYYHAERAEESIALSSPEATFLGDRVTIVDQDDTHYVLQRTDGPRSVQPKARKKRKGWKEP